MHLYIVYFSNIMFLKYYAQQLARVYIAGIIYVTHAGVSDQIQFIYLLSVVISTIPVMDYCLIPPKTIGVQF